MKGETKVRVKIYRHGDVLLRQVTEKPSGKWRQHKRLTVQLGEATGHHHDLVGPRKNSILALEIEMRRYLELSDKCELRHQEHKTLQIDPGLYEVIIEREWDYIENQRKKVVD